MEYFIDIKKEIEEALYVLIWNNLQNVLLINKARYRTMFQVFYICIKEREGECTGTVLSLAEYKEISNVSCLQGREVGR